MVYSAAGACVWNGNDNIDANNLPVGGRREEETPRRVAPIGEYRRRSKLKGWLSIHFPFSSFELPLSSSTSERT